MSRREILIIEATKEKLTIAVNLTATEWRDIYPSGQEQFRRMVADLNVAEIIREWREQTRPDPLKRAKRAGKREPMDDVEVVYERGGIEIRA